MILQYLNKKENKYKNIADKIYVSILNQSKELIKNEFFTEKSFDNSFEIISIILIFKLKTIKDLKESKYKIINDLVMQNFISDLDQSFRQNGIGDMSIGKYVKKYVKKFYFRIKLIDPILEDFDEKKFAKHLNSMNSIDKKYTTSIITSFREIYDQIKTNHLVI